MKSSNFFKSPFKVRFDKTLLLPIGFLLLLSISLLTTSESFSFWGGDDLGTCEGIVNNSIKTKSVDANATKIVEVCAKGARTGSHKELYSYFKIYDLVDRSFKDQMENNRYHWMLFYANENSRDFDPKTNSFKKEQGLYEQELKDFEDAMTQEEKIKAFAYIADNLAVGKEGWVKVNDYKKSFEYLKKAAEVGDIGMQSALGASYFLGNDWMNKFKIEKNFIEGYKWMYLATIHSEQFAHEYKIHQKSLNRMKIMMQKSEIIESKKLINAWLKENSNFIKNHPLKITTMTKEEIAKEREKTNKFIEEYELDKPLPKNNINQNNQ